MPKKGTNSRKQNKSAKNSKRRKGKTKTNKGRQRYFEDFQKVLAPKGIYMRDVDGDGNCLFRSVADQIEGSEDNHRAYRDLALKHIKENAEVFKLFLLEDETIEDYLEDMDEDGTWGGHFELVALSEALNCNFCLHMKEQDPVIIHGSTTNARSKCPTYHLAYHVDEHYSSVRKMGDDGNTPAEPISLSSVMKQKEEVKSSDDEEEEGKTNKGKKQGKGRGKDSDSDDDTQINEYKKSSKNKNKASDSTQVSKQGNKASAKSMVKVGDGAKCPCGSKLKYKKCCKNK